VQHAPGVLNSEMLSDFSVIYIKLILMIKSIEIEPCMIKIP